MKRLLSIILCLTLISFASAIELSPEYSTKTIIKEYLNPIDLTLTIHDAVPGTYNLFTLSDLEISPSQTFVLREEELERGPFVKEFVFTPTINLDVEGLYTLIYTLNHRNVEKIDERLTVDIVNLEDILEVGADTISPLEKNPRFYIENKADVNITSISASFSSILFDAARDFSLQPFEKKYFNLDIDNELLTTTKAGVYILEATFYTPKGERSITGNIFLGEEKGILSQEDSSGILIRTQSVTKINTGNVLESVEVTLEKNIFSRFFTTFTSEPTRTTRTGTKIEYFWSKDRLGPSESFTVKARTNYILPLLIIFFGFFAIIGIKRYNEAKIEIFKSVSPIKTKNDDFALRITVSVKAKKDIENLTLTDKIPPIVKIFRKFGSIKPNKIDPETRKLVWNLGDLVAGEERIFNYVVYSKVGIVGKFSLPEILAIFEREGSVYEAKSNKIFFLNEQIKG